MFATRSFWVRAALWNLFIVACLGLVMRYKIAFSLPWVDQKHLLHAHSHFAFAGWISLVLMALLAWCVHPPGEKRFAPKYRTLLGLQLISAYGMLICFVLQGYGAWSISFSTISVLLSFVYSAVLWRDINRAGDDRPSYRWFKAALVFNVISAAGTFYLAYMMMSHTMNQRVYLASVYYYLHFQYNGWFFFACMGLFAWALYRRGIRLPSFNLSFLLFVLACVPAYVLSALWLPLPVWMYAIVVLSAFAQLAGGWLLVRDLRMQWAKIRAAFSPAARWLLVLAGLSLAVKLLLQAASTVPALSTFAFGFRPIIIAYLHLVLLGVITLFLLGYLVAEKMIGLVKAGYAALIIFVTGIFLNELLLAVQGAAAMTYTYVPNINEALVFVSLLMVLGLLALAGSQYTFRRPADVPDAAATN